ncbi:MAG: glycosyltransferase family 2 protein [Clostridiales bacterium]|nr:glycosyltransferase family 2 protein [Clostridiales bacterium]
MSPKEQARVCFIVVNWNRSEALKACLTSIQTLVTGTSRAIIVVDNASTDGSAEMVEKNFPGARLLKDEENIGFARANNKALQYLKAAGLTPDYVVFINNDALLVDSSVEKIFEFMDRQEDVAAAIPAVFLKDASFQTGVGGFDLSLGSAFAYYFFLSGLFPRAFRGLFIRQDYFFKKKKRARLEWLSGVCLVARRSVLDETGGFPEEYFMYAEDLALCRKLRKKGALVYFPEARILHLKENGDKGRWNVAWIDSLFRYFRLHQKKTFLELKEFALKGILFSGFALRAAGYAFLRLLGGRKYALKTDELASYARHVLGHLWASQKA